MLLREQGLNDVMPPSAPGSQITQLYWDWTSPLQTARLWQDESIGGDGFGECVTDGPFAHAADKASRTSPSDQRTDTEVARVTRPLTSNLSIFVLL